MKWSPHLRTGAIALLAAGGVLAGVLGALAPIALSAPAADTGPAPSFTLSDSSPCVVTPTVSLSPPFPLLGESVSGTVRIGVNCPEPVFPLHVVFVIDNTGRLGSTDQREMRDAAISLVEDVYLCQTDPVRAGVVGFDVGARTYARLTTDKDRVIGAIRRMNGRDGAEIVKGLDRGREVLVAGRKLHDYPDEIQEILIVFSCGPAEGECAPALRAGNDVKSQGILFITVCAGPDCYAQCMRQMASSPRYFFQIQEGAKLRQVFQPIRQERSSAVARELTMTATLGADMRLLGEQHDPHVVFADPLEGLIVWSTTSVPREGATYTLEVEPLAPGGRPLFERAEGRIGDFRNLYSEFEVSQIQTTVLQPMRLPVRPRGR